MGGATPPEPTPGTQILPHPFALNTYALSALVEASETTWAVTVSTMVGPAVRFMLTQLLFSMALAPS